MVDGRREPNLARKEQVMALETPKVIDVTDSPDLRRVVEGVRDAGAPYVLRIGDRDVALLTPLPGVEPIQGPERRVKSEADRQAFLSAFGGWKGLVDGERRKRDAVASRGSDRPPVVLRVP